MKTNNAILTDIWRIVSDNAAIVALDGGIYKTTRPTDSVLNDCVISLISGTSEKFIANGALSIKLFYNDNFSNNTYNEDFVKGSELETMLFNLSKTLLSINGYSFDIQSREHYTAPMEEVHEHYAILKMNFELLN